MKNYSVQQIAEMLGTNPETVRRWIRDKKLPAVQVSRKDGNVVTEDELQKFLKASPKYLPRFTGYMAGLAPVVAIPLLLGGLLGSKVAGYMDDKKNYDVRVRPEDIEKYLTENITAHTESIKRKQASIKQLQDEIATEEQQLEQLKYLMSHRELLTEAENNGASKAPDDGKESK